MRSVFTLDKENKVVLIPEAVKLCPGLSSLKENELLYIIWAYDYRSSPLRLKPLEERKYIAKRKFLDEKFKEDKLEKKIEEYISLIFCTKRSKIDAYKRKYVEAEKKLLEEDVEESLNIEKITKTMDYFEKRIGNMEEELAYEEEQVNIGKGKELTWIELQKRKRDYLKSQGIEE